MIHDLETIGRPVAAYLATHPALALVAAVLAALVLLGGLWEFLAFAFHWVRDGRNPHVPDDAWEVHQLLNTAALLLVNTGLLQESVERGWAVSRGGARYLPGWADAIPTGLFGNQLEALVDVGWAEVVPLEPCGHDGPPVDCDTPGRCAVHGSIGSPDLVLTTAGRWALHVATGDDPAEWRRLSMTADRGGRTVAPTPEPVGLDLWDTDDANDDADRLPF